MSIERADELYKSGDFQKAREQYESAQESAERSLKLGTLALMSNRLEDAERWLEDARKQGAPDKDVDLQLGLLAYRRNELGKAAEFFRKTGSLGRAEMAASFADEALYTVNGPDEVTIPFTVLDPLPVVRAKINCESVALLIDAGGPELILDDALVDEMGIPLIGSEETGTFAGGRTAKHRYGRLDSLIFGDLSIEGVPLLVRPIKLPFGDEPVRGIIGTILLHQFLSTIDYPGQALILRSKDGRSLKELEKGARAVAPIWIAGIFVVRIQRRVHGPVASLRFASPEYIEGLVLRDPESKGDKGPLALEVLVGHGTPCLVDYIPGVDPSDHLTFPSPDAKDGSSHELPYPLVLLVIHPVGQSRIRALVLHVEVLIAESLESKVEARHTEGAESEEG